MIKIEPSGTSDALRPGDELEVWCRWRFDRETPPLTARLVWRVSGWGTPGERVVQSTPIATGKPHGSERVRFLLPDGPYSLNGQLLSIAWCVELQSGEEVARWDFVLGHDGRRVELGSVES